jgi:biotin carboxyl carrier protein
MESQQEGGSPVTKGRCVASVGNHSFEINVVSEGSLEIDGQELGFDFKPLDNRSFSLILKGVSHVVQDVSNETDTHFRHDDLHGPLGRNIVVAIKGKAYAVTIDDDRSLLFKKLVANVPQASTDDVVRAPMPGLISRISVQVGEEVSKGQSLVVLEAMKMENEIRASGFGRIKKICITKGKPVEKGEVLVVVGGL